MGTSKLLKRGRNNGCADGKKEKTSPYAHAIALGWANLLKLSADTIESDIKDPAMNALTDNDKVRKTSSTPALEVSVSFGRFGNDLFSCEKRSNLSPNKYLEEVEKCSTAGSVAQKKAYFEAHYQKIATQKAEPFEQEKQNKDNSLRTDYQTGADLISKAFEGNPRKGEVKLETTLIDDVLEKDVRCVMEWKKKEFEQILDCLEMNKPREADLVEKFEETHCIESKDIKEQPESLISEKPNKVLTKEKVVKSNWDMAPEKIAQSKKEKNTATAKKQQMSSIVKPHKMMNPRVSKTTLSPITLASQLSSKANYNNSSLLRSRNHSSVENKKLAPKYLNMSLNLGSYGSHPSSVTLSKSFIMEKTEDKDSVKRAFKTCHNNFSQLNSSGEDRSVSKKVTAKGTESRISTLLTTRKENRGAETLRNLKAPNSVSPLRSSDEQTKKTKELLKKVEEKTKSKEGERRSLQSKSKVEQVEAEMKNLRKNSNFRAAPAKVFPTTKIVK